MDNTHFRERYRKYLSIQQESGLYRNPHEIKYRDGKYVTIDDKPVLNFASNDYLGLSTNQELRMILNGVSEKYTYSSSSSRLVTGNYSIIREAEKFYASYFGYEDCLFFSSGYLANLALMTTLFEQGDIVFFDKHSHASTVKGLEYSKAHTIGYKHNTMQHLQARIQKLNSNPPLAIVTESLFSMDGDLLPVDELTVLKKKHNLFCIVDEAHSFGVLGNNGKGIAGNLADIAIGTFGKSFGLFGAFVLLPSDIRNYLINFASPLIYSTTLPELHAACAIEILRYIEHQNALRGQIAQTSRLLKSTLSENGFGVKGDAHILAIHIGNAHEAVRISNALLKEKIYLFPARYPTVPIGQAILRVSITALHDSEDIKNLVECLIKLINKKVNL